MTTYTQIITPNPDIPCTPGWCLMYVRQTFDLPAHYNTATEAWENSASQHADYDFPEGVDHAVWFSLEAIPAGHVALRMADGSVYSSSDNVDMPHHHPSLQDLLDYYAYYNLPLTYLGWTEDVAGTPVITPDTINGQGAIAPGQDTDMPITPEDAQLVADKLLDTPIDRKGSFGGETSLRGVVAYYDAGIAATISGAAEATARLLFTTKFARQGDGQTGDTDLGSVVSWSDSNFTHAGSAELAAATGLNPDQVNAAIKAGLDAALAGTHATITLDGK